MRVIGKIFLGILFLALALLAGAYVWFWGRPVGVNNYINKATLEFAIASPELLSQLGAIDNTPLDFHSGKLGDYTKAREEKDLEKLRRVRAGLDRYGPEGLEGQELLSYRIAAFFFDDLLRAAEFEYGGYRVNQISGVTVDMPQFLTDIHVIKNEKSAERYVSRINEFGRVLREVKARVEDDRANGVTPPDFIIEKALVGMRSFIEGGVEANPLLTTLPDRLDKIEGLSEAEKTGFITATEKAITEQVIPGYEAMIELFEEMAIGADHDAGIWRLPDGDKIYAARLKSNTTTDLTAGEVHNVGLSEVSRIEKEMHAILDDQGFPRTAPLSDADATFEENGAAEEKLLTIADRVRLVSQSEGQIYPNTDEGRQQLLDYLVSLNEDVMSKAGDYFITLPPQPVEIVRVPEYSQDSAPGGYYSMPAIDGSRPGRFYINLKDTADNPRWTLPTLLYHEAAPGHHFQISTAQLIEGVPFIRKLGPFSAYTEGWALYAERLASEDMNLYAEDPLGDLGRLQAEMFRAVRLVVDTGLHHKRWSREQAIAYMLEKTGMTEAEVTREIERYVVWPGQATSYKTGMIAIQRMRARAEEALGDEFDLRQFHETVLLNGAMPLGILDDVIDDWIEEQQAG